MTYPHSDPSGGFPQGGWGGAPGSPYGYTIDHPQAATILVLGIVSIVLCQICGPFAWVMGRRALEEIDSQPGRYGNRGLVQAGYICGIVGSVLLGLYLIGGILYLIAAIAILGAA